jgi:Fe-S cluster assembly scaffold protein SufB
MTVPTEESAPDPSAPVRPRPARRGAKDLSLSVELADVEALDGDGPAWLAADRRDAFERFERLPIESNRLYTPYVDMRGADLTAVRLARTVRAGVESAVLPDDADGLLVIGEDGPAAAALSADARAKGVTLTTLGELLGRDPEHARRLLEGGGTLPGDDRLAQLTRALWTDGIVLEVPDGVRLDRPVLLRWMVGGGGRALIGRTSITLGSGASASVVEEFVASPGAIPGAGPSLLTGTSEVVLGRGAELAMASIQELAGSTVAFQHRRSAIGEGASLHWALAQLGGRLVRSRVDNRLEGDRSSVEQVEIVFGGREQLFDLTSYTTHIGRDTTGNLLSKGALLDRSRSFMKGLITIDKSAVGTDSFLGEFGMNLSKAARAVAIPSLEIDQPDCRRAAHSSSVGPIDENQLFYLESRGIPLDEARKFIVLGFLEPVVARVPLGDAQDRLRELLEAKWDEGTASAAAA